MGMILYFYYCIVKKMWANTRSLQTTGNKEILKQRDRTNKRVMVVLLAIAVAFFSMCFSKVNNFGDTRHKWYRQHGKYHLPHMEIYCSFSLFVQFLRKSIQLFIYE